MHYFQKFICICTVQFQTIDVTLEDEIIANVAEEKKLAIANGEVDKDGIPFITVIGDGGWGVRSYNHSMKSPVGCVSFNVDYFSSFSLDITFTTSL